MRWRPTWIHWTVAGIALVVAVPVAVALTIRAGGFARYDRVIAELKAGGEPASPRDLVALAPPVDEERQERWWAWSQAHPFPDIVLYPGGDEAWMSDRMRPIPASASAQLAAAETWLHQGRMLLREGPIDASTAGCLHRDLRRIEVHPAPLREVRLPSMSALRALANALVLEALRGDPDALADLDLLLSAVDRPVTPIDNMIAVSLGSIRDQAFLRLAYRRWIDDVPLEAWMREPPPQRRWLAESLHGERLLFLPLSIADARERPIASAREAVGFMGEAWWHPISAFLFVGGDAAESETLQRAMERRLRDEAPWPDVATTVARMHPRFAEALAQSVTATETMAVAEAVHRAVRVAARLLRGPHQDAATAIAAVAVDELAATPDRLGLGATAIGPHRVRIDLDAAAPVPDFCDRARLSWWLWRAPTRSKSGFVLTRSGVELELARP